MKQTKKKKQSGYVVLLKNGDVLLYAPKYYISPKRLTEMMNRRLEKNSIKPDDIESWGVC